MIDPDTLKGRISISRMVGSNKYKKEIDGYIIIKRGTFIVVVGKSRIWAWWTGLEEKYYEGVIRSELTSTAS